MSRAWDVSFGVMAVITLWSWMLLSVKVEGPAWWFTVLTLSKVIMACAITGPIYREYMK